MSWDNNDLNGYTSACNQSIGQITLNSRIGQFLYNYALNDEYINFLEIGTWNGLGSTKCFIEAFLKRTTSYKFYSLECNKDKSDYAKKLYKNMNNVYILNEVLLNNIPDDINNIFPELLINKHFNYWNSIDFENMKDKPLFLNRTDIPIFFDVILLDGGEFTTWYEYLLIKDICKILILDDANSNKCKKIVEDIKQSNLWNIIFENDERNGVFICKRINT
jgi:hypothetical protein